MLFWTASECAAVTDKLYDFGTLIAMARQRNLPLYAKLYSARRFSIFLNTITLGEGEMMLVDAQKDV
jgi:hypothetical protein